MGIGLWQIHRPFDLLMYLCLLAVSYLQKFSSHSRKHQVKFKTLKIYCRLFLFGTSGPLTNLKVCGISIALQTFPALHLVLNNILPHFFIVDKCRSILKHCQEGFKALVKKYHR